MMDDFVTACEFLQSEYPADLNPEDFSHPLFRRIATTIEQVQSGKPVQTDLACLIMHMLRRETIIQESNQLIKVPRNANFPKPDDWLNCGVTIVSETDTHYQIEAKPWEPEWLQFGSEQSPPGSLAFGEKELRTSEKVPGDSILCFLGAELGFKEYLSIGQKEAVKAALATPEGATLIINLPTGSGKSLCIHLPALLESKPVGVTIVVIPTTALAIDQEERLAHIIDHPTAYQYSKNESGKRKKIRDRIRDGTQRIVFASPESVLGSLSAPIYEAAEKGFLRWLVIDEVHMVEQWGDNFRPSFQELSGLRRDLLRLTSFKTMLLTATLPESSLDTLELMFGDPGPFEIVSSVNLRPEPSYWPVRCENEVRKVERVLEAVYHLPRPIILYTTEVADANRWHSRLTEKNFKRIGLITGAISSSKRREQMDLWRQRKIDLMVATSAFGLGVDQSDVRTVIHACFPETIDRYYQEVGRGGRDGKASLSLIVYYERDVEIAKRLNKKVFIGDERGLQRWKRMFESKEILSDSQIRVKIDLAPGYSTQRDIDMDSKENTKWNIRTLNLMSCAGLIEIDYERPKLDTDGFGNFEKYDDLLNVDLTGLQYQTKVIRILEDQHQFEETWQTMVEKFRSKRKDFADRSFQLIKAGISGSICISENFQEAYYVPRRNPSGTTQSRKEISITRSCGGCVFCRKENRKPSFQPPPTPKPVWEAKHFNLSTDLTALLQNERLLVVFLDSQIDFKSVADKLQKCIIWFINQGCRDLVIAEESLSDLVANDIVQKNLKGFTYNQLAEIRFSKLPSVILIAKESSRLPRSFFQKNPDSPVRVLIVLDTFPDPNRPERLLRDTFNGKNFKLNELLSRLFI